MRSKLEPDPALNCGGNNRLNQHAVNDDREDHDRERFGEGFDGRFHFSTLFPAFRMAVYTTFRSRRPGRAMIRRGAHF